MNKVKLLIAALLLGSGVTNAAVIKLGVENISYLPYYATDKGVYSGFAHELFEMYADHSGHMIEYHPLPVSRLFNEFISGKVDWKFPDNPKWKEDAKKDYNIVYSKDIVKYTDGIFVKKENVKSGKLSSVGTVRGFTPWPIMDKVTSKQIRLVENNDLPALFKMLTLNRVDGVYANKAVGKYQLIETNYIEVIEFDPTLANTSNYYSIGAVNKHELIKDFNDFLQAKKQEVMALKEKYLLD